MDIVDENRRTPDEMAMLEVLEPGMKEIVVEGRGDQAILRWFLKLAAPQADIDVFAVEDRVLLNEDTIASHGYNIGRRGSVITLAEIVHAEHSDGTRLRFVADRDFNALGLDECPELPNLYFTDFTSMELYFFAEKSIEKMLRVALRAPLEVDAKTAVSAITPVLVTLFKIRFVLRTLPNPKKLAGKIIDNLKFTPAGNSLDVRDAFVRSCQGVDVRNLLERFSQVLIPGDFDTRHFIRGHDVSAVLVRYISSLYGSLLREDRRYLSQPAAMEITLATCLELVDFDDFDLFRKIREYSLGRS